MSDESAMELYYWMSLTRAVEERALNLYRQGKLPGSYYTGRGQEAIAVGIALPLRRGELGDWLSPWIRDLGSYLVHGVPPWRIFAQFMGKAGLDDARQGRQPAHRRARVEHPLPGLPYGRHDPAHRRRGAGLRPAGRGPGGGDELRRRGQRRGETSMRA